MTNELLYKQALTLRSKLFTLSYDSDNDQVNRLVKKACLRTSRRFAQITMNKLILNL